MPRSAIDCKHWLRSAYTAITAAAYDTELATKWIARVADEDVKYADLRDTEGEPSLDNMIRVNITRLMTGDSAKRAHRLVAELQRVHDVEWAKPEKGFPER